MTTTEVTTTIRNLKELMNMKEEQQTEIILFAASAAQGFRPL